MSDNTKAVEIINTIIKQYSSFRAFARAISEDGADITRWRANKTKIKARAIVSICRLHPEITPHDLNPNIFPPDLRFVFEENKDKT